MRTLFWLGLGAAAMYLLDPEQGPRRRALARDKMIKARRVVRERAAGTARHEIETPEGARHLGR
jgi:hypothetical protein